MASYVLDQLNAPRITRYGRTIKPVAFIRIGRNRAALFFNRDELPSYDAIEYQLERQHVQLRTFKESGAFVMIGFRRE